MEPRSDFSVAVINGRLMVIGGMRWDLLRSSQPLILFIVLPQRRGRVSEQCGDLLPCLQQVCPISKIWTLKVYVIQVEPRSWADYCKGWVGLYQCAQFRHDPLVFLWSEHVFLIPFVLLSLANVASILVLFVVNKENRPWRSGGKKGFWDMICVQCNLFMTENTLLVNLMTQNTIFDICGDGWKTYGYKLSLRVVSVTALLFWNIFMSKWFRLVPADPRINFTYSINLRSFNWKSKH